MIKHPAPNTAVKAVVLRVRSWEPETSLLRRSRRPFRYGRCLLSALRSSAVVGYGGSRWGAPVFSVLHAPEWLAGFLRGCSPPIHNAFFYDLHEYIRPWKLATLFVGVALLVIGSFVMPAPDWDIPISFIMAFCSYLTAPCSVRVLVERRWRHWPTMLLATWFSVDGCYALYWYFVNPGALALMRDVNFPASLSLYGMCGVIWLYRGSLHELLAESRNFFRPTGTRR